ncbi:MAG: hypothetical protein CMJ78_09250 [Planctomycetaceae bacterium]|nr:hypothetical protein [Planctomycetaceae bacterium]
MIGGICVKNSTMWETVLWRDAAPTVVPDNRGIRLTYVPDSPTDFSRSSKAQFMPVALVPLKQGRKIMLDKPVLLVGRHPDCDVILTKSRKISRKHCAIAHVDDRLMIRDLGSVNGIWVNGQRADPVLEIRVGDQVGIADLLYCLQIEKKVNGNGKANGKPPKQVELKPQRVEKLPEDFRPEPEDKEPDTEHQMQAFSPNAHVIGSDSESIEVTSSPPFDLDRDSASDVVPLKD